MRVPFALVICAALALPVAAFAQAPARPPANDTESSEPKGKPTTSDPCASGRASVGSGNEVVAPNAKKDQTLSDHLAQSGGVICPPPGTPGGDQSVQPK